MTRALCDIEGGRLCGRPPRVRGRFAPTPSGRMHLGNALSCLLAWAAARSAGGEMVLRIEDLDPATQDPKVAERLMDDLRWLGLDWDVGPLYQHDHARAYGEALATLEAEGLVYPCFCSRRELHAATAPHASDGTYVYAGTCRDLGAEEVARRLAKRPAALRLRVPEADDPARLVAFDDEVFGPQRQDLARECGDFLVRRSDGVFAYQLAVVVDDGAEGVTQVVRGRDLLGSTARQIYLQGLLGLERPSYLHVPLLMAPDGRRLSKRERDLDLGALRGRLGRPERLVGFLASLVGLAAPGEELRASEVAARFSPAALRAHRDDVVIDDAMVARLLSE